MSQVLIYVTAENKAEAVAIARAVVGERLAACANVLEGMTAVFRWDGAVREAGETVLILKTRADLADALTARIEALHGYDTPCVVALPIVAGNTDFLTWIDAETAEV